MSPSCESFIKAVLAKNWQLAVTTLNGLSMYEMLRGLAALDILDRTDLWNNRQAFANKPMLDRIEYAWSVVDKNALPGTAPGDLVQTGQVGDANTFLSNRTPLVFDRDLTGTLPVPSAGPPTLTETDYSRAASTIGCEISAVQAVAQVEAGGRHGFASDGRPIVRYELHVFQAETGSVYAKSHPHLSQPNLASGKRYHDGTQINEWSMVYGAMILRRPDGNRRTVEAVRSASWGMFQVMGNNHVAAGRGDALSFASDMFVSEGNHLRAFLGYVSMAGLNGAFIRHEWADVARGYNGPAYATNHYDERMEAAYDRIHADRARRKLPL